ncbi:hypothetical protein [Alysiella filiformis]|uniref:Lipoprotein n=1 Tax=Alysiella filiformis DSM 16848 TaxID=1120981 RepID=A0A286E5V3_9NEIS|nr:hypothetical protein [Alysiella filiformis]QMT32383.1 hypothetical protein H3L97_06035 [Alysiella filiformis]UBQ56696.1 hypothetical protein JF568_02655 [Alysiella filiformis DSM 16848]SOD66282.1 hypothetical protein SAMN02746062_00572 [Alysiella filiformis DSM 16848]
MKTQFLSLIIGSLMLAACNGQPSGGVAAAPQASAPAESVAVQPAETAPAELKSKNGKIAIAVSGAFADKLGDATMLPENVQAEELLLLQHDTDKNIGIYAIQAGEVADGKAYLNKLAQAIKNDAALKNSQANLTENQLTYHFSQTDESGETALNESCLVAVQDKQVYNVCATSEDADLAALDEIISKVRIEP